MALNDDINKDVKFKRKWEERILELGGPDYHALETQERDLTDG